MLLNICSSVLGNNIYYGIFNSRHHHVLKLIMQKGASWRKRHLYTRVKNEMEIFDFSGKKKKSSEESYSYKNLGEVCSLAQAPF